MAWTGGLLIIAQQGPAVETAFVCPMHPDYTTEVEGKCPRCGMALVKASPFDVRDYELEFTTTPKLVRAGQRATWRLAVLHPETHKPITAFEVVHEKQYHLFVISQDMEYFQHLHPELQPDGAWTIDVTLPKAGFYTVLSDFMPRAGAWQFLVRPLVTAGYAGDLEDDSAILVPDTKLTKEVNGLTASLSFDPPTFVAGQYGHLNYHLLDTATGRPVTDLQTYLGAFGHTLIMSEDLTQYVHSHPLDIVPGTEDDGDPQFFIPPGADLEKLRGGPEVTFDALMPRPGRYRAWTQFRRNEVVHTFSYTFAVSAP
jgi:5-hydroxyisourate hydrolase-like protein (transthyretin family)